jgi:hypothetical protein
MTRLRHRRQSRGSKQGFHPVIVRRMEQSTCCTRGYCTNEPTDWPGPQVVSVTPPRAGRRAPSAPTRRFDAKTPDRPRDDGVDRSPAPVVTRNRRKQGACGVEAAVLGEDGEHGVARTRAASWPTKKRPE